MKKLLLVFLFIPLVSCSVKDGEIVEISLNDNGEEIILIKDFDFENILVLLGVDDIVDGSILKSDAEKVTEIDLLQNDGSRNPLYEKYMVNIKSLSGIGGFTSLQKFRLRDANKIETADFSKNTKLTYLFLVNSNVEQVDLSGCTSLKTIFLDDNLISEIDLEKNTLIEFLSLPMNPLKTFPDTSKMTYLEQIWVQRMNQNSSFKSIDISKNERLSQFYSAGNPSLVCVKISQSQYDELNSFPGQGTNCVPKFDSESSCCCSCLTSAICDSSTIRRFEKGEGVVFTTDNCN